MMPPQGPNVPPAPAQTFNCPAAGCGFANPRGAARCGRCGAQFAQPQGQQGGVAPQQPQFGPPPQQGFAPPAAANGAANLGTPPAQQPQGGVQPLVFNHQPGVSPGWLAAAAVAAALLAGGGVYAFTHRDPPPPPPRGGPERTPDEPRTNPREPDVAGGGNGPLVNGPLVTNNGGGCCGGNVGVPTTQWVPVRTPVSLQIPTAWLQSGQPFATRLPSGQWVTIRSNPATGQIETRPTQPPAQQQLQGQQGGGAQQPPAQPNPPAAPAQPPVTRRIVFPFV